MPHTVSLFQKIKGHHGCHFSVILIEILKIARFPDHCDRIFYVSESIQGPFPVTIGVVKDIVADSELNSTLSYSLVQVLFAFNLYPYEIVELQNN